MARFPACAGQSNMSAANREVELNALQTSNTRRIMRRCVVFGVLLLIEGGYLGVRFDVDSIRNVTRTWWGEYLPRLSVLIPQIMIAAATVAALIGGRRFGRELSRAISTAPSSHRTWPYLLAHLISYGAFIRLTREVFEGTAAASFPKLALWGVSGICVPAFLLAAALPLAAATSIFRRTGQLLVIAAVAGSAAWLVGYLLEFVLQPLQTATLTSAYRLLALGVADATRNVADLVVGTERFSVSIKRQCSGYQGIGMIWVFLGVYLWAFRDALRFPRALLLIPVATVAVWLANVVRIVALVLIGSWGWETLALGGFHRYVGALLFSAIALSIAYLAHRSPLLSTEAADSEPAAPAGATTAYLSPMLAILAAALVTGAFSVSEFDYAYPVRVLAAGGCLWWFRHGYGELRWRLSPMAAGIGTIVFLLWVLLASKDTPGTGPSPLPALAAMPAAAAYGWAAFRVAGAVVAVPLAEELAFRGYLARRVSAIDFRRIPLTEVSWLGIAVSSLAFGALHGRFVAGTLAGLAYALAAKREGRLIDAVVAHATTNALLAAYVLITRNWSVWG